MSPLCFDAQTAASVLIFPLHSYDKRKSLRPRRNVKTAMQHELSMYAIAQASCLFRTPLSNLTRLWPVVSDSFSPTPNLAEGRPAWTRL